VCRLFGLRADRAVRATFWLLDAPDSLVAQSRRNPDGAGIGLFDPARLPVVDKAPIAAWQDADFATEARALTSPTFLAHVRYASTGGHTRANTHPFVQDERIFAHNGAFTGLAELDRRLGELGVAELVEGQTDSERLFALITGETRQRNGDVDAGLVAALNWVIDRLPVLALNLIVATADQLWALRYPDTHQLYVLQRRGGGRGLEATSPRIHARSNDLGGCDCVIVASEAMDGEDGWRALAPGELLRVDADLSVHSSFPFPAAPRHRLTVADLGLEAGASQR
jgi:predicted glutamine amidotransferase